MANKQCYDNGIGRLIYDDLKFFNEKTFVEKKHTFNTTRGERQHSPWWHLGGSVIKKQKQN